MWNSRVRIRLLFRVATAFGSIAASAAPAFARDSAAAEALYRAAKEMAKKGDWEKACAQFAESQRMDAAPGTLLNLADCEEHRGLVTSAWTHFIEAESQFKSGDTRAAYARERAAALEPRIPRLTVRLQPGAPRAARVFRDAEELKEASLGVPLPVDPGPHVVIVRVGSAEARVAVTTTEGEVTEIVASPPAEVPRAPEETTLPPSRVGPRLDKNVEVTDTRTRGWVLVGVGSTAIAVGAVTGTIALSKANTVKEVCGPDYLTCNGTSVDAASTGRTMATVSTVSLIAGGALAFAGVYFVLRSPSRSAASSASRTKISLGPAALIVRGTF